MFNRYTLRKWMGPLAVFIFSLVLGSCSKNEDKNSAKSAKEIKKKPNIVVIMTDQERYPAHWPKGWVEKNLPATGRLKQHGLTFHKAYTSACECSPSRAVLTTGQYSIINRVPRTPPTTGIPSAKELMDIGSLLKDKSEYEVVWKGKWHLSPPLDGGHDWTFKDITNLQKKYDIFRWNPPDAGTAITEHIKNPNGSDFNGLTTLGGGYANNDGRFVQGMTQGNSKQTQGYGESAIAYIEKIASTDPEKRKPFCLFVSLVNPHDVWVYPKHWEEAGYNKDEFSKMGIGLPNNFHDDLISKPSIQLRARKAFSDLYPLKNRNEEKDYVNFYAYLTKLADSHVEKILNALDKAGLIDDTIIIRTADHGELGLSHGMREKAYTVYEEMIHIPFIVSNPILFPNPQTTHAFYSHVDLVPTLAELAGIPKYWQYGKGVSVGPVIKNPSQTVQDSILFAFDDTFFLPADTPGSHIRAIREGDWTYAVYYSEDGSHFEFEMYNLKHDPKQLYNLLYKKVTAENAAEAKRLHQKLKEKIDYANALPKGFNWPELPF